VIKSWRWIDRGPTGISFHSGTWDLVDGQGRDRATIWRNDEKRYTWHTWDDRGTGGENSEVTSLDDAKRHCVAAIVRQGWAPGGWKVLW
jgi:hypothetical protein